MIETVEEGLENYKKLLGEILVQRRALIDKIISEYRCVSIAADNRVGLLGAERLAAAEKILGLNKEEILNCRKEFGL